MKISIALLSRAMENSLGPGIPCVPKQIASHASGTLQMVVTVATHTEQPQRKRRERFWMLGVHVLHTFALVELQQTTAGGEARFVDVRNGTHRMLLKGGRENKHVVSSTAYTDTGSSLCTFHT